MAWQRPAVSGVPPVPRSLHTAVVGNNKIYIFGGWTKDESKANSHNGTTADDDTSLTPMQREWTCTNSLGIFDLGVNNGRFDFRFQFR